MPPSGLDDARIAAAHQGWFHIVEHWWCPDCHPLIGPVEDTAAGEAVES